MVKMFGNSFHVQQTQTNSITPVELYPFKLTYSDEGWPLGQTVAPEHTAKTTANDQLTYMLCLHERN